MKLLTLSKILDYLSLIGIIVILALYLFMHLGFVPIAFSLMGLLLLRVGVYMCRAKHYEKEYKKLLNEVQDIIK